MNALPSLLTLQIDAKMISFTDFVSHTERRLVPFFPISSPVSLPLNSSGILALKAALVLL